MEICTTDSLPFLHEPSCIEQEFDSMADMQGLSLNKCFIMYEQLRVCNMWCASYCGALRLPKHFTEKVKCLDKTV